MRKYLLILFSLLFSLNLYPADKTLELILPISLRTDTLYGPDLPHFAEKLKGSCYYGLGVKFRVQKPSFLIDLNAHYEKRQETAPPKREGKLRNSVFELEAGIYKGIFRAITFRTRLKFFKEKFCPFFYIPRSMLFESYIPIDCSYSELWALIGIGMLLGDYQDNYLVAGLSSGCLWRKKSLKNGSMKMTYTKIPSHTFLLGPFVSLRVNIFNLPFSIFIDLESQRGIGKEEEATWLSGGLNVRLFSSTGLVVRLFKESNKTRKSKGAEGGLRIRF